MRTTLFALAIACSVLSGNLQAAKLHQSLTHKVRKGETAARVARDNGLSLNELAALNPKIKLSRLTAGAVLRVGADKAAPRLASVRTPSRKGHLVQPMAPLPGTPALGPATLVHLEGILPADVRRLPPTVAESDHVNLGASSSPALASLRTVLPEGQPTEAAPAPVTGFEPADPAHLDLLWPVETRTVSSAWGPRMRIRTVRVKAAKRKVRYRGSHKGVDLSAPSGTDVFAALDGVVVEANRRKDYGNFVMVDHGNGVVTLYAHHNRNFVKAGEVVRRGQKIAEVGRTGNATGPHLHFELRVAGSVRNPLPMLNDVEEIPAELVAQNQAAVAPSRSR